MRTIGTQKVNIKASENYNIIITEILSKEDLAVAVIIIASVFNKRLFISSLPFFSPVSFFVLRVYVSV